MQRVFIFIVTWILLAIIVMTLMYIGFRLFLKARWDLKRSTKRKKRRKRKHEK